MLKESFILTLSVQRAGKSATERFLIFMACNLLLCQAALSNHVYILFLSIYLDTSNYMMLRRLLSAFTGKLSADGVHESST